jgi:sugar transferase EpsL
MFKRCFDLIVILFLLVLLWPVILLVGVLCLINFGRPILFSQVRPGKNAKLFKLYKFRTMTLECNKNGELLPDAQRLTKFGQFLRSTSLDELPQLFNVLKGDLSLVGPRPLLPEYLPLYTAEQARRHEVKPGITGWAQVNGRNAISWEERFKLDVWYVDHQSFWLDIKILWLTCLSVLQRKGITQQGEVTMSRFTGSKANDKTQTRTNTHSS